jgi:Calcineurin-like phosphoesterase
MVRCILALIPFLVAVGWERANHPTTIEAPKATVQEPGPSYKQWRLACAKLAANRELKGKLPDKKLLPLPKFADFERSLDGYLQSEREGPLADAKAWVGERPDPKAFFDFENTWYGGKKVAFQPFAAKLVLPNDATVVLMGDLHGDVRSLLCTLDELNGRKILDGFKLRASKHYLLFLGDFTDRGAYGTEVLSTLFRLKLANPDRVYFARGNHEDFHIVSRYGFLDELRSKYGQEAKITKVMRSHDLMPVVYYVGTGTDFLQMNHGGMEPGYDPRRLLAASGSLRFELLGKLQQKAYHAARAGWLGNDPQAREVAEEHFRDFTPEAPTRPRSIGFMWNDFTVFADEPALAYDRSLVFGARPTRRILADASTDKARVRGVVRAHQHVAALNPLMSRLVACDGVFRHWQENESTADADKSVDAIRRQLHPEASRSIPDGSVWTFNASPDSVYGVGCRCDFATVGLLKLAPAFKDWRMSVLRIHVF